MKREPKLFDIEDYRPISPKGLYSLDKLINLSGAVIKKYGFVPMEKTFSTKQRVLSLLLESENLNRSYLPDPIEDIAEDVIEMANNLNPLTQNMCFSRGISRSLMNHRNEYNDMMKNLVQDEFISIRKIASVCALVHKYYDGSSIGFCVGKKLNTMVSESMDKKSVTVNILKIEKLGQKHHYQEKVSMRSIDNVSYLWYTSSKVLIKAFESLKYDRETYLSGQPLLLKSFDIDESEHVNGYIYHINRVKFEDVSDI